MNFGNISGYENEKKDILSIRNMLHNAEKYHELGIRIPRGLIFHGKPGVGKTVLARSISDDGIRLVELRAADCCTENTQDAIRAAFEDAKANTPSVLLLDELDKIAGTNPNFFMEGNDDVKKVLLQELDKLKDTDTVLVVATANDVECLGNALLRPGRFDRSIHVQVPDAKTRILILKQYLSKLSMRKAVDVEYLAEITAGFTGAMLECLVNESAIYVTENGRKSVSLNDVKTIMNRMAFEEYEKDPIQDKDVLYQIAVHEAGHALVAMLKCPDKIHGASVKPQGNSGGHISIVHNEEPIISISSIEDEISVLLAGRVAERVVAGVTGIGAQNDIQKASVKLLDLITRNAAYGYRYYFGTISHPRFYSIASEKLKNDIENLFDEKMNKFDKEIEQMIKENRRLFDGIVSALVERQILSREELFELKEEFRIAA